MNQGMTSTSQDVFTDSEFRQQRPSVSQHLMLTTAILTTKSGEPYTLHLKHCGPKTSMIILDGFGNIGDLRHNASDGKSIQLRITDSIIVAMRANSHSWKCSPDVAALLLFGFCPFVIAMQHTREAFISRYPVEAMRALAQLGRPL